MIATHNIKVNGRWVVAGEEYQPEEPEKNQEEQVEKLEKLEKPVKQETVQEEKPAKEEPKAKTTSTRRKKISE